MRSAAGSPRRGARAFLSFSEQRRDIGLHVVVGAAVGAALGRDRKDATDAPGVAAGPREDPSYPVGSLVQLESLGDLLAADPSTVSRSSTPERRL